MTTANRHLGAVLGAALLTAPPAFGQTVPEAFRDPLNDGGFGPLLVVIPPGEALLGSPPEQPGHRDDEQLIEVRIDDGFALAKYETSFAEYDRFASATGRPLPADQDWPRGNRPVLNVSWDDAQAYAAWLSRQTGQRYRLPTEVEWEYAARAGSSTIYWWGSEVGEENAVCLHCRGRSNQDFDWQTSAVDSHPANGFGLHHMLGNVWEWTCSVYVEHYDGREQTCAAAENRDLRAIRGGSYLNPPTLIRSAVRDSFLPMDANELVGFRVLRELD